AVDGDGDGLPSGQIAHYLCRVAVQSPGALVATEECAPAARSLFDVKKRRKIRRLRSDAVESGLGRGEAVRSLDKVGASARPGVRIAAADRGQRGGQRLPGEVDGGAGHALGVEGYGSLIADIAVDHSEHALALGEAAHDLGLWCGGRVVVARELGA